MSVSKHFDIKTDQILQYFIEFIKDLKNLYLGLIQSQYYDDEGKLEK